MDETTTQFTCQDLDMWNMANLFEWMAKGVLSCLYDGSTTWWIHRGNTDSVLAHLKDDTTRWSAHPMEDHQMRSLASTIGEDALVGVIDEAVGGIIGYAHADIVDRLISALNGERITRVYEATVIHTRRVTVQAEGRADVSLVALDESQILGTRWSSTAVEDIEVVEGVRR